MKLKLIYPTHRHFNHRRLLNIAIPFNLCVLAAHTPKDVEVSITDAYFQGIDYDERVDLVGITCLTPSALQAYAIAAGFRDRGVKVVLGGIHPSAMPKEALEHADAVVVGEAEGVWPGVIEDFKAGRMSGIYQSEKKPDLAGMPFARRDLCAPRKYLVRSLVETSRGCPFNCMYCSDWLVYGNRYRFRPVEEVVEEVRSLGKKFVVFVDNNIAGNITRAKELFEALIPLRIRWVGQASITFGYDEELVRLAARSGCLGVLVGLETLKKDLLKIIGKPVDPGKYIEHIARIQRHGIFVQGEFIFGFDEDDPSVFKETVDFAIRAKLGSARFAILKPYPGTRIYEQFLKDGRMLTANWEKFHTRNVVYRPKHLTVGELSRGRDWAYNEFASIASIYKRVGFTKKLSWLLWLLNLANRGFKNTRGYAQPHFSS
jgi:radical SAM superfamily enzyme YgiQ (UPF0313 family)